MRAAPLHARETVTWAGTGSLGGLGSAGTVCCWGGQVIYRFDWPLDQVPGLVDAVIAVIARHACAGPGAHCEERP